MRRYRAVFFDLDHTLWDYEKNSIETLTELYHEFGLSKRPKVALQDFVDTFDKVNSKLWANYNKGHIDRHVIADQRFKRILRAFDIRHDIMAREMSEEYISRCPEKTHLFPYAQQVLQYLYPRYDLYILTNGFNDIQDVKLERAKLKGFFKGVITSESSGHRKPSSQIFQFSLDLANVSAGEAVMIGDNLNADIAGARKVNIDHIYFNPGKYDHDEQVTYEIDCLSQLANIL